MVEDCQVIESDVLVIGAGGAGCQAALAAAACGVRVTLVDKGRLGLSGSTFDPFTRGKGITVAAEGFNPSADPQVHFTEAMAAARGLADPALVRIVAEEGPRRFRELLDMGLAFRPNQLRACFGDAMVGAVIDQPDLARAFRRLVLARPIRLLERTMVAGLLVGDRGCTGAVAVNRHAGWRLRHGGRWLVLPSRATILATGGASTMFRYNLNASGLTGDGYVLALQAGAELTNLEFYQAILGTTGPARVYFPQWYLAGNPPLRNAQGRDFLARHVPAGLDPGQLVVERSRHGPFTASRPSGWVDIALDAEIQAGRGRPGPLPGIDCDYASLPAGLRRALDEQEQRPALAWLRARHVDVEAGPVPIAPFAHAFNGGVIIDAHGQTRIPGLLACGEVTAGAHGANRIGGHMFAVLLVFGARAGTRAAELARNSPPPPPDWDGVARVRQDAARLCGAGDGLTPAQVRRAIQQALGPVMIAKDEASLQAAAAALAGIRETQPGRVAARSAHDPFAVQAPDGEALSVANLLEVAAILVQAARLRRESRGPHYRRDFPGEADRPFRQNLIWRQAQHGPAARWARLDRGESRDNAWNEPP